MKSTPQKIFEDKTHSRRTHSIRNPLVISVAGPRLFGNAKKPEIAAAETRIGILNKTFDRIRWISDPPPGAKRAGRAVGRRSGRVPLAHPYLCKAVPSGLRGQSYP